jgi:hypothetical protein
MSEYIYLINCNGVYKIGVATDVRSRFASLQTGNPYKLELVDCFQFPNAEFVERVLHQKYDHYRMLGEWFNLPNVLVGEFHQICEMLGGVRISNGNAVTQDEIEEAEEIDASLENVRTELRMANGSPLGVVLVTRSTPKKVVRYVGKRDKEFEKYLELYKQEHPNSKALGFE